MSRNNQRLRVIRMYTDGKITLKQAERMHAEIMSSLSGSPFPAIPAESALERILKGITYVSAKKKDLDTDGVKSGAGAQVSTTQLVLGYFYDAILDDAVKGKVYVHAESIPAPFYEKTLRQSQQHKSSTTKFHRELNKFVKHVTFNDALQRGVALITIANPQKAHSVALVLDKSTLPVITLEYYDSNGEVPIYSYDTQEIDTMCSYFKRNASEIAKATNTPQMKIVCSTPVRQTSLASCTLWSTFVAIFRMCGVPHADLPTDETTMLPISQQYRDAVKKAFQWDEDRDDLSKTALQKSVNDGLFAYLLESVGDRSQPTDPPNEVTIDVTTPCSQKFKGKFKTGDDDKPVVKTGATRFVQKAFLEFISQPDASRTYKTEKDEENEHDWNQTIVQTDRTLKYAGEYLIQPPKDLQTATDDLMVTYQGRPFQIKKDTKFLLNENGGVVIPSYTAAVEHARRALHPPSIKIQIATRLAEERNVRDLATMLTLRNILYKFPFMDVQFRKDCIMFRYRLHRPLGDGALATDYGALARETLGTVDFSSDDGTRDWGNYKVWKKTFNDGNVVLLNQPLQDYNEGTDNNKLGISKSGSVYWCGKPGASVSENFRKAVNTFHELQLFTKTMTQARFTPKDHGRTKESESLDSDAECALWYETYKYPPTAAIENSTPVTPLVKVKDTIPLNTITWTSKNGEWSIEGETDDKHTGSYSFDKPTITITEDGNENTHSSTVIMAKAQVSDTDFETYFESKESDALLPSLGITVHIGAIQDDIQTKSGRHRVFVLPSQLNAAEYPDQFTIVKKVQAYKDDPTGGPRGQLAADPGVAQFILDNASNEQRPDKGIDNTRLMGPMPGVTLQNGYLQVDETQAPANAFGKHLKDMTVLGVRNVRVVGLDGSYESFVSEEHKVDLIYASAVPLTPHYGNTCGPETTRIANMTLYAQYVASMRLALERGSCDLFLMPLGGGVFANEPSNIRRAIGAAYNTLKTELTDKKVNVHVLVFKDNPIECAAFGAPNLCPLTSDFLRIIDAQKAQPVKIKGRNYTVWKANGDVLNVQPSAEYYNKSSSTEKMGIKPSSQSVHWEKEPMVQVTKEVLEMADIVARLILCELTENVLLHMDSDLKTVTLKQQEGEQILLRKYYVWKKNVNGSDVLNVQLSEDYHNSSQDNKLGISPSGRSVLWCNEEEPLLRNEILDLAEKVFRAVSDGALATDDGALATKVNPGPFDVNASEFAFYEGVKCGFCGTIQGFNRSGVVGNGCDYTQDKWCSGCNTRLCLYCGGAVATINTESKGNTSGHNEEGVTPRRGSRNAHFGFRYPASSDDFPVPPRSGWCLKRPGVGRFPPSK